MLLHFRTRAGLPIVGQSRVCEEVSRYASVRRYEVAPGDAPELIKKAEDEFAPIISQVPGFIAYYALDQGDGVVASINIFEDRQGAEESNRRAKDFVNTLRDQMPNPAQVTAGEVVVHRKGEVVRSAEAQGHSGVEARTGAFSEFRRNLGSRLTPDTVARGRDGVRPGDSEPRPGIVNLS